MRTTVDLPDDLFRSAKARAAMQGQALKEVIADGLRLLLNAPEAKKKSRRVKFPLIRSKNPARKITPEMIAAAEDELLAEEAAAYARFIRC